MVLPQGLKHLAIIMDGNGRWATERGMSRLDGHIKGYETLLDMVQVLADYKVPEVSFFAMSSENLTRPKAEVDHLMGLFLRGAEEAMEKLQERRVVVKIVGDVSHAPDAVIASIDKIHALVVIEPVMQINICFLYGGMWHIESAVTRCLEEKADLSRFRELVNQPFLSSIDLMIRTGGDMRISNFALWHLAYAELVFIAPYWPDFDKQILDGCLATFASRKRRFGQLS
jgi:undecaprenyl diphosphate synthase